MFKIRLNTLKFEFSLTPKSPILIKSGVVSPDPSLPDMWFVRTQSSEGDMVYIPGSSLKGVFRSFTEKIIRTVEGKPVNGKGACDPFERDIDSDYLFCGEKLKDEENTAQIYKNSCRACKIYGNTRLKGRFSLSDLKPSGTIKTEIRYGVAISRLTHAVAQGPFEMEIVVDGKFTGIAVLNNFEIWQLGLISFTFSSLNEGIVRIGFGKNRGLGEVSTKVEGVYIDYPLNSVKSKNELWGIGKLVSDEERINYGLSKEDLLTDIPKPDNTQNLGIYERRFYSPEKWSEISTKSIEFLKHIWGVS